MEAYDKHDCERRGKHQSAAARRNEFEVDKGRIVHSAAFRRLQGKTQVLGVGERDFYRTRLTHSLEVAQLGRGLCSELPDAEFAPNADLVETICLAHDIGHPPFGHSGEGFLHAKMRSAGGFGANPQNLRIVTLLETKYIDSGLDLTRAALDGLMKYPEPYDPTKDQGSKFTYASEPDDHDLYNWVKQEASWRATTPVESQLADWADQMAYSVNDIEDVVRAGLLDFIDMRNRAEDISLRVRNKLEKNARKRGVAVDYVRPITDPSAIIELAHTFQHEFAEPKEYRMRKANLKGWTSDAIKKLKNGCRIVKADTTASSIRYRYRLYVPPEAEALATVLKETAFLLVFKDPRVTTLEAKGKFIIDILFESFCNDTELLPLDFQELIKAGTLGSKERLVADFIAGMTDRYAYDYYKRMFHPGVGSFYEYV